MLIVNGFAQTTFESSQLDFGDLTAGSQRFKDIRLSSTQHSKVYILRVTPSPEVTYKITSDVIFPDSSLVMRVQVNPRKNGPFHYSIAVYFSDQSDPVVLKITGNQQEGVPSNLATSCPDFNGTPPQMNSKSTLTIITTDKETGVPLAQSTVAIIRNGEPAGAWITGKKGAFNAAIPDGYFYFYVTHEGYLKKEAGIYVPPTIHEITIPLSKNPSYCPPPPQAEPIIVADESQSLSPEQAETLLAEELAVTQSDSLIQSVQPELAAIPVTDFSSNYFNDVNVVFVLDISSSMKLGDKMDLLKYSLNQLVVKLRPTDRMGIVTYSDNAEVFQTPTTCDQKEALQASISNLRPKGMTAGGKGIKLGYKQVLQHYDATKTNMVIVITDGAFNKDSDDYQKLVKKYAKKGIVLSVVGIHAKPKDAQLMSEAASFGKGRYVPIDQLSDAHNNLTQEIRIASFKKTSR
jgi:Ca-activated chloride channel family protein